MVENNTFLQEADGEKTRGQTGDHITRTVQKLVPGGKS